MVLSSLASPWAARVGLAVAAVAAAVTIVACGDDVVDAADYDQSCQVATDCVVVNVGDLCECSCETAAISRSEESRYRDDTSGRSCSKQCEPCPALGPPLCTNGACTVGP